MNERLIQIIGVVLAGLYGLLIVFLYAAEPRSLEDAATKARTAIETAAIKGQVAIGTYEIDRAKFEAGLAAFRADNHIAARDLFAAADPETRNAEVQFYVAYSFYRQGWGRVASDDDLYRKGIDSLERVRTLDANFRSADDGLGLRSPAELRAEMEQGLQVTADDFNPFKVFRERK